MSGAGLKVIKPITVTASMVTASNLTEDDYGEWDSGTTYADLDYVIVAADHKVYQSVADSNTNHEPSTNIPTWWLEVSPTNRYKAFDTSSSTQTEGASGITYTLETGYGFTSVGFSNLEASTVRVRVVDSSGNTTYDVTHDLVTELRESLWHSYFFAPCLLKKEDIFFDISCAATSKLLLDIDNGASTAAVGVIVLGSPLTIGDGIHSGAKTSIVDYSVKTTNEWGDAVFTVRAYAKRAEFSMIVQNGVADAVQEQLAAVRATPCFWIGYEQMTRTMIYGFYRDFDMTISYVDFSELSISIEGMT